MCGSLVSDNLQLRYIYAFSQEIKDKIKKQLLGRARTKTMTHMHRHAHNPSLQGTTTTLESSRACAHRQRSRTSARRSRATLLHAACSFRPQAQPTRSRFMTRRIIPAARLYVEEARVLRAQTRRTQSFTAAACDRREAARGASMRGKCKQRMKGDMVRRIHVSHTN